MSNTLEFLLDSYKRDVIFLSNHSNTYYWNLPKFGVDDVNKQGNLDLFFNTGDSAIKLLLH